MIILRIIEWHLQPIPDGDLGPTGLTCVRVQREKRKSFYI